MDSDAGAVALVVGAAMLMEGCEAQVVPTAMAVRVAWWPVVGDGGWFQRRRVCQGVITFWIGPG